jgi:hypothetical protein
MIQQGNGSFAPEPGMTRQLKISTMLDLPADQTYAVAEDPACVRP